MPKSSPAARAQPSKHRKAARAEVAKGPPATPGRPGRKRLSPPEEGGEYELPQLSSELEALLDEADAYAEGDLASRTRDAYRRHWGAFTAWCRAEGVPPLPASPQVLRGYLVRRSKAGCRVATLSLDLSAIVHEHKAHGFADPTAHPSVKRTWLGLRKKLGTAQEQKAPATVEVVRKMLEGLPSGLLGTRDRALLTLGFSGGFRRSELVALDVAHLHFVRGAGLEVMVPRSKTDQSGAGHTKEIAYGRDPSTCPVRALKDWLALAEITDGPVFRSVSRHGHVSAGRLTAQVVRLVVKRALEAAGVPSDAYSAHSLRAGLVTTAKARGIDDADIMKVTGHRSLQTMHKYDRRTKRWKDPATGRLGL